jgi:hypothetical protein
MTATDESGRSTSVSLSMQIVTNPNSNTIVFSSTNAVSGVYVVTITFSQAVSGFGSSSLTLQGLSCTSRSASSTQYSFDCTATGSHAPVSVALQAAIAGVSPANVAHAAVSTPYT